MTIKKAGAIQSKWSIEKLGDKVNVLIGGTPPRDTPAYFTGQNLWVSIAEMTGQTIRDTKEKITDDAIKKSNVKLIPTGTTLLSFKLSIGKTAIAGVPLYTNEAIAGLIPKDKNEICDAYLFHLFNAKQIDLDNTGYKAFGKSLNSAFLKNDVQIPLPPLAIQQQIVVECEAVDTEAATVLGSIEISRNAIAELVDISFEQKHKVKKLAALVYINRYTCEPTQLGTSEFTYVDIESVGKGTGIIDFSKRIAVNDAPSRARRIAKENSVLISTVRPNLKGFAFVEKELPGCIYSTGFAIIESKNESELMGKFLYQCFMNSSALMRQMEATMGKAAYPSISKTDIENYSIPVPSLADQQRIVAETEKLGKTIADAQAVLAAAPAKKQAIMQRYL